MSAAVATFGLLYRLPDNTEGLSSCTGSARVPWRCILLLNRHGVWLAGQAAIQTIRAEFYNNLMLLEGIFAAVTTPFYPDERVYFRKLEANMAHYSRTLLSGMLVLGSTGEAVMLDDDESRDVLRVGAEATTPEKILIAGVARDSVKATLALAEAAAVFRYDAVLIRTPTYFANQMQAGAVLHYYRSVADRSPLPVIIYDISSVCTL